MRSLMADAGADLPAIAVREELVREAQEMAEESIGRGECQLGLQPQQVIPLQPRQPGPQDRGQ